MVHSFRMYPLIFLVYSVHHVIQFFPSSEPNRRPTMTRKNEMNKYKPNLIHSNLWARSRKNYDGIIKFFLKLKETLSFSSWTKIYATHQCCHSDCARKKYYKAHFRRCTYKLWMWVLILYIFPRGNGHLTS